MTANSNDDTINAREYLTAKQAAQRMGVSVQTVRAMCNDGVLTDAEVSSGRWRIPTQSVDAWLRKRPGSPRINARNTKSQGRASQSRRLRPPTRWQRFRYNPWVFYPTTVLSIVIILAGVLFGVIQAGADFGMFSRQVKAWGLVREFPSEREGETLIVIAKFYHSEGIADTEAHSEIRAAIKEAAAEQGDTRIRVEMLSQSIAADDLGQARSTAKRYNASIIIWGADTGIRVTVNFLRPKEFGFDADMIKFSNSRDTQIANPNEYGRLVTEQLPSQLRFLSLYSIAHAYYCAGRFSDGAHLLERSLAELSVEPEIKDEMSGAYFLLGWLSDALNDKRRALESYTLAIELDPDFAEAYNNRGIVRYESADLRGALQDFSMAVDLQPDFSEAYSNRSSVRSDQGDYEASIIDIDKAIRLDPMNPVLYNQRGTVRLLNGNDLALAIDDFEAAIKIEPEYSLPYNNLGLALDANHDSIGAIAMYSKAIELGLDDPQVYLNRATAYASRMNTNDAIADYTRAIDLWPSFPAAHKSRGLLFREKAQIDRALTDFHRYLELALDAPDRPQVEQWIAELEQQLGTPQPQPGATP